MGFYKELNVQFGEDVFMAAENVPDTEFIMIETGEGKRGYCNVWQNLDRFQREFWDGSRTFRCVLTTKPFDELTDSNYKLSGVNATRLISNTLNKVLGIEDDIITNCTRWMNGPLNLTSPIENGCVYQIFDGVKEEWVGAYPTLRVDWNETDYDCYNASLPADAADCSEGEDPLLIFSGEGTCYRQFAYQHGGWFSGIRDANEILRLMLDPDQYSMWESHATPQFCEEPASGGPGNSFIKKSKALP
jgi:hypothetical protein